MSRRVAQYGVELGALAALVCLVWLFYFPRGDPLESRYVYYADVFERAGHLLNPDYQGGYHRLSWERISPFSTLVARTTLYLFAPGHAVLVMHVGIVGVALLATYLASRLYLSMVGSFFVTILIFCDRVLLPLARGLGVTSVHLLIPLSLIFLACLPRLLDRSTTVRRALAPAALGGIVLAVIYLLGSHEVVFATACGALAVAWAAARWTVRSIRAKRVMPGPPRALVLSSAIAAVVAVTLMAVVWSGLAPQRGGHPSFFMGLTYTSFLRRSMSDVTAESHAGLVEKLAVWRGTFIEGRYVTERGMHHENTFLYPGRGFNGVLPLFLVPGLLIGAAVFARQWRAALRGPAGLIPLPRRLLLHFVFLLLVLFVATMALTDDPKPTRYTFWVFAVYVLTAWGYEAMVRWLGRWWAIRRLGRAPQTPSKQGGASLWAAIVVCGPLAVLLGMRLAKNYLDLQAYRVEYARQIPTLRLDTALAEVTGTDDTRLAALVCGMETHSPKNPPRRHHLSHPAIGLKLGYRTDRFVEGPEQIAGLAAGTRLVVPMATSSPLYGLPGNWKLLRVFPGGPVRRPCLQFEVTSGDHGPWVDSAHAEALNLNFRWREGALMPDGWNLIWAGSWLASPENVVRASADDRSAVSLRCSPVKRQYFYTGPGRLRDPPGSLAEPHTPVLTPGSWYRLDCAIGSGTNDVRLYLYLFDESGTRSTLRFGRIGAVDEPVRCTFLFGGMAEPMRYRLCLRLQGGGSVWLGDMRLQMQALHEPSDRAVGARRRTVPSDETAAEPGARRR